MHPCNQNKFINSCIQNNKNFKHIKFINEIFPKLNQMIVFLCQILNLINGSSKPGTHRTKCQIANDKQYYIFRVKSQSEVQRVKSQSEALYRRMPQPQYSKSTKCSNKQFPNISKLFKGDYFLNVSRSRVGILLYPHRRTSLKRIPAADHWPM